MLMLLAAGLLWLPSTGSGTTAEFLLRSEGEPVVVIINTSLSANGACYMWIEANAPSVLVLSDSTKQWGSESEKCAVSVRKDQASVRIAVQFKGVWTGEQTVYVWRRLDEQWYRAGTWNVRADQLPMLPPVEFGGGKDGKDGKDGAKGEKGDIGPAGPIKNSHNDILNISIDKIRLYPDVEGVWGPTFSELIFADVSGTGVGGLTLMLQGRDFGVVSNGIRPIKPWPANSLVYALRILPMVVMWVELPNQVGGK